MGFAVTVESLNIDMYVCLQFAPLNVRFPTLQNTYVHYFVLRVVISRRQLLQLLLDLLHFSLRFPFKLLRILINLPNTILTSNNLLTIYLFNFLLFCTRIYLLFLFLLILVYLRTKLRQINQGVPEFGIHSDYNIGDVINKNFA